MKTLALGDTHGRTFWKSIIKKESPQRVIFVGDYFDTREDITPAQQIDNFIEIIELKKTTDIEVILLIGNHDYHYFPEIGYCGTSGYQSGAAVAINQILNENRKLLQMVYQMDEFVFTHAGISKVFMDETFGEGNWTSNNMAELINEKWLYQPKSFNFNGFEPSGDDQCQTPIWIRPRSLMTANRDNLNKEVIQVIGHTSVRKIDINGSSTGIRYFFIDALGTSGEYLIINDGEITTDKY